MAWAMRLRGALAPAQVQALLETAMLRERAAVKFNRAAQMYFVREGLEQASAEAVSRYRAGRYEAQGFSRLLDLCCGLGGDTLALAALGEVWGVDLDPLRLALAGHNVGVYGLSGRFHPVAGDVMGLDGGKMPALDALFCDPARRDEQGRRAYRFADYSPPPLLLWERWRRWVEHAGIKISPAVHYHELPPQSEAEIEFISLKGEVKEGVLWFGGLHSGVARRATLLPGPHTLTSDDLPAQTAILPPQQFLYEPDRAIIRAHLVEALAARLNAGKIDEEIAYLTANIPQPTPFARCFAIEASFPFQLKQLRHYLRQRDVGQVIIKKRGSPLEPEQLQRQLRLRGSRSCILFLTQVKGEPTVIVGEEVRD